jgi:hypothetical protein
MPRYGIGFGRTGALFHGFLEGGWDCFGTSMVITLHRLSPYG